MRESKFNSEVVASLRAAKAWAYKVPDSPTSWTMGITRYTPEKPCDIIGIYRRIGFLIECKQIKKFEAFGMRHIRPSQIKNLDEVVNGGGYGFIFLNIRIKGVKGEKSHENRLLIFDWPSFKARTDSIKAKEIAEMPHIKGSKGQFDLEFFMEQL